MFQKPTHAAAILAVIALGAFLRIHGVGDRGYYNIDFVAYHREASFIDEFFRWRASGTANRPPFPESIRERPEVSVPSHAKPLHVELQRLAFRVWGENPAAMSWMCGLLGAANVGLTWCLAKQLFPSGWVPPVAALFTALSGYNVMYAGRGYNHSVVTTFGILVAIALCRANGRGTGKGLAFTFLAGICAGLALASHYNVVVSLPLVAGFSFCAGASWRTRFLYAAAAGAGIAAVVAAFDAYYAWIQSHYPALETYVQQIVRQSGTAGGVAFDFWQLLNYGRINVALDGWFMTALMLLGLAAAVARSVQACAQNGVRALGPLAYVATVVAWSLVFWGSYNYQVPRTQSFAMFGFPLFAAIGLHEIHAAINKASSSNQLLARNVVLLVGLVVCGEAGYRTSRLFDLGSGHEQAARFVVAHDRKPAGNVCYATDAKLHRWQYPAEGSTKIWYLDIDELSLRDGRDCVIIDYASLYHNFLYQPMGAQLLANRMMEYLDAHCRPLLDVPYPAADLCMLDGGRLWWVPTITGQPLSGRVRIYEIADAAMALRAAKADFLGEKSTAPGGP